MIRGTTPTHIFGVNIDLTEAEALFVTYRQSGTVLEKTIDDCLVEKEEIQVTLSQEDTLAFKSIGDPVRIQVRARFPDGTAVASNIISVPACKILKDGVI